MNEAIKKSEAKTQMERALLAAVIHMGSESLSPDDFDALLKVTRQLADTRNLGEAPLVDFEDGHTSSDQETKESSEIRIVFDGPPSHESGRFVEVEDTQRCSINVGKWHERDDGLWELRIPNVTR